MLQIDVGIGKRRSVFPWALVGEPGICIEAGIHIGMFGRKSSIFVVYEKGYSSYSMAPIFFFVKACVSLTSRFTEVLLSQIEILSWHVYRKFWDICGIAKILFSKVFCLYLQVGVKYRRTY